MKKFSSGSNVDRELRCWASLLAVSAYGVKNSPYHHPFQPDEIPQYKHPSNFNVESVIVEGVNYISLNGALHIIYCASHSSNFAEVELRRMLRSSPMKCVQMTAAPAHPLFGMQGEIDRVNGGSAFWTHAWWFNNVMSHPGTSSEWRHWLLNGGIVIERELIEEVCLKVIRSTHQDEIRIVRSRCPDFVPITDALATAISHGFNVNFDCQSGVADWSDLMKIESTESLLGPMYDGFEILLNAIKSRGVQLWALRQSDSNPLPIIPNDVYGVRFVAGGNSGGLMGYGDMKSFALFRSQELNSAFPNASFKAKSVIDDQKSESVAGRPKGTKYNDDAIIKEVFEIIDDQEKENRAEASRIALARHGGGQGASERAITERIAAAVRKIRPRSR
jgi:hypothetical protein